MVTNFVRIFSLCSYFVVSITKIYLLTNVHYTAVVVGAVGDVAGSRSSIQLGQVILLTAAPKLSSSLRPLQSGQKTGKETGKETVQEIGREKGKEEGKEIAFDT